MQRDMNQRPIKAVTEGERPLIGILTASYNVVDALRRTVESVAGQDFGDVEHVVVDGGSNDGTVAYLETLPPSVRWISEPDKGIADALNKGVAMSRAHYLLVLQADDELVDAGALSRAALELGGGADIVSYDVCVTGGGERRVYAARGFGALSEFFMTVPHQGAFCSRALYERIGAFDGSLKVAMDYDFMLRAKRAGARIVTRNEVIAYMPDGGVSSRRDWPSLQARLAENRSLHKRHSDGVMRRVVSNAFWSVYPLYKRLRHLRG